jgi:hypothetical protein
MRKQSIDSRCAHSRADFAFLRSRFANICAPGRARISAASTIGARRGC